MSPLVLCYNVLLYQKLLADLSRILACKFEELTAVNFEELNAAFLKFTKRAHEMLRHEEKEGTGYECIQADISESCSKVTDVDCVPSKSNKLPENSYM